MAQFEPAYKFALKWAGGYVNDPADSGGETYRDIARKSNPNWTGWEIIDRIKQDHKPKWNEYFNSPELDRLHYEYSKDLFWDKQAFGTLKSQAVANVIFEFFWGSGYTGLKTALGVLSAMAGKTFKKWNEDAIQAINQLNPASYVTNMLKARKAFYEALVAKRPKDEKFLKGWLRRLSALAKSLGETAGDVAKVVSEHKTGIGIGAGVLLLGAAIYLYGKK